VTSNVYPSSIKHGIPIPQMMWTIDCFAGSFVQPSTRGDIEWYVHHKQQAPCSIGSDGSDLAKSALPSEASVSTQFSPLRDTLRTSGNQTI